MLEMFSMKTDETTLAEFIHDFRLEVPGVGVCFDANVEFTTTTLSRQFTCEVHIITMALTKQSVIYLLDKELAELGIPDAFSFDPEAFSYERNKSLQVSDYDLLRGKFSLKITPVQVPRTTTEVTSPL